MLKLTSLITPSAMLAAFTLAAAPSIAQERYHGRQNPSGQESSGRSAERAQPRSEAPRAQGAAPRVESRQETPRAQQPGPVETPRAQQPRQAETPRVESQQQAQTPRAGSQRQAQPPRQAEQQRPAQQQQQQQQQQRQVEQQRPAQQQPQRQAEQPRAQNRGNDNRAYDNRGNDNRRSDNRGYDNRGNDNRRYESGRAVPRGNVYAPRYSPRYSPRGYGYYGSRSYYRPYVFRPRFSIGIGIYAGYPVPYTYSYPYPIMVYGYRAPRERVMITPGSSYYGGVALEITPYDADVFVDGEYAGHVEDFDGTTQPLTLTAGTHRIEVRAPGYEPMVVDIGVQPGQVIPYRGDLRPY